MKRILAAIISVIMLLAVTPSENVSAATFDIDFETECKSLYLENLDTGVVVYQKAPNE